MPSRRTFLAATAAALPLSALATRGAAAVPAGSVTNPTGSVAGNSVGGLRSAYTGEFGGIVCPAGTAMAQWNHLVLCSNAADACASGSPFLAGELTVRAVLFSYIELPDCASPYPPAGDLPLVMSVASGGGPYDTSDGVHRYISGYFNKAKASGQAGNDVAATGGSFTFTRMDNVQFEGSYSLTFPSGGTAAGSFVAPWCGAAP